MPLRKYERHIAKRNILGFTQLPTFSFNLIVYFLIIIGMYSCLFYMRNIPLVFSYGINEVRQNQLIFYSSSIFSKIAVLGAYSSSISIFLFFYIITTYNNFNTKAKLLLITSLSFIFYTLNVGGRDGFVIWSLYFIASYCLFYLFIPDKFKTNLKHFFIIILLLIIPVFWTMTMARFGTKEGTKGAVESIFSYIGQPLANFSYNIDFSIKTGTRSGEGFYPLEILDIIFLNKNFRMNRMERIIYLQDLGFRPNQFASYINSFYPSYPFYTLLIFITICLCVFYQYRFRKNKIVSEKLLIVYVWYTILIVGVFYFYYSTLAGNVYLLLPLIFSMIIKVSRI